ncbi:MAG TPA: hypothetical protein PKI54_11670, partial [Bacteroidia bacterium]|nr:hypothetical protein [Bacteroidia bacterium]
MKKGLLITLALGAAATLNAQEATKKTNKLEAIDNGVKLNVSQRVHGVSGTTFTAGCENTLGSSANAFTAINGGRSNLIYNSALNTIAFIHRGNPSGGVGTNSGDLFWDISTDGGATWNINQGPSYTVANGNLARYPMGSIYNPVGNTDPANAWVAGFGSNTGGSGWISQTHCTSKLDGTNANQEVQDFVQGAFMGDIPSSMETDNVGNVW